jgi:hypothetical protein
MDKFLEELHFPRWQRVLAKRAGQSYELELRGGSDGGSLDDATLRIVTSDLRGKSELELPLSGRSVLARDGDGGAEVSRSARPLDDHTVESTRRSTQSHAPPGQRQHALCGRWLAAIGLCCVVACVPQLFQAGSASRAAPCAAGRDRHWHVTLRAAPLLRARSHRALSEGEPPLLGLHAHPHRRRTHDPRGAQAHACRSHGLDARHRLAHRRQGRQAARAVQRVSVCRRSVLSAAALAPSTLATASAHVPYRRLKLGSRVPS